MNNNPYETPRTELKLTELNFQKHFSSFWDGIYYGAAAGSLAGTITGMILFPDLELFQPSAAGLNVLLASLTGSALGSAVGGAIGLAKIISGYLSK